MEREKTTAKPPKGQTDHELLLMLVSEFREFKGYVLDMFKKHGWTK